MVVLQPVPLEMLLRSLMPCPGWWWSQPWGAMWDVMPRSALHSAGSQSLLPSQQAQQARVSKMLLPRLLRLVCVYAKLLTASR